MNRKKIIIVEPRGVEANVFAQYIKLPLLGPLYLGTILKNAGFDVRVINENLIGRKVEISELKADFLLITSLTSTVERGYEIAQLFHKMNPQGIVIMGGVHVSFMVEEALQYSDYVVRGEGENIIVDLLKYGSDERVINGSVVQDLDLIPIPDWSILMNSSSLDVAPIMTSRGCPFSCEFCCVTKMFGRKYRFSSAERVVEEIKNAISPKIFFYDDNFTANKNRSYELIDQILKVRNRIRKWSAQVRADCAKDPELVQRMARSGCSRVYIGFESINEETLKSLNKKQNLNDIINAIDVFHRYGIRIHGMFIIGSDTDSLSTIKETVNFIKKNRIDSVQFMLLTPLPGTEMYAKFEKEKRLLHKMWQFYDGMHLVFKPEEIPSTYMQDAMIKSYEEFYSIVESFNDALNLLFETILSKKGSDFKNLISSIFINLQTRLGGSFIVKKWKSLNREYLKYLKLIVNES